MVTGLRGLKSRLLEIREYLEAVVAGRLPVNHDIMRNLQVRCWDLSGASRG
jgi:26S proteasome regulatory subunit N8